MGSKFPFAIKGNIFTNSGYLDLYIFGGFYSAYHRTQIHSKLFGTNCLKDGTVRYFFGLGFIQKTLLRP